ncbi:MAG: LysM peptidoglycan-binding domain-containing protein [Ilumatobacter sp.]|nr:MAG: LysM peptidoglycan-binding domain-containing protein [Ilumatobacter sp.]
MHTLSPTPRRARAPYVLLIAFAVVLGTALAVTGGSTPRVSGSGHGTCPGATYLVAPGETWFGIARDAGVGVAALLSANDATETRVLHPDDALCLPVGASVPTSGSGRGGSGSGTGAAGTYTVVAGDSWFDVARRSGVTLRALLAVNGAIESRIIHPGETLTLPPGAASGSDTPSGAPSGNAEYTVGSGDSWYGIARRVQVSIRALFAANDASELRQLHPGDILRLPDGADLSGASERESAAAVSLDALPMQGPCWYTDSWHAPRGGGRLHVGVDLFAAMGSHVYAVVDGTLTNRVWDQPGMRSGNGWWLTAHDGSASYFYAHLDDFAPDLQVGSRVEAGQIIGFMGNTGNSAFPHLHFEIRPRGGSPINPYPIVKAAGGCKTGTGYQQPSGWTPGA